MLGFDAIGRLALGQVATSSSGAAFQQIISGPWEMPRKAGLTVAVIATSFVGFVAPPPAQAAVFSQFSQPTAPRISLPDEQPSALFEAPPPPQPTAVFARFSEPAPIRRTLDSFTNAPQPAFVQPYVFGQFSQPVASRTVLTDEQPSALFDVEPPALPPFTGFAQFEGIQRARFNVAVFSDIKFVVSPITVDTHDGVWVKRKRKRTGPDPIEFELAEKAARRAALELAVYGPEVEYSEPPTVFAAPAPKPVNVADLAKVISVAQAQQIQAKRSQAEQDEESDLEAILREIL
jgi:hypothetical protein